MVPGDLQAHAAKLFEESDGTQIDLAHLGMTVLPGVWLIAYVLTNLV